MCVFRVNGSNLFEAKFIGIGWKSHVNVVFDDLILCLTFIGKKIHKTGA